MLTVVCAWKRSKSGGELIEGIGSELVRSLLDPDQKRAIVHPIFAPRNIIMVDAHDADRRGRRPSKDTRVMGRGKKAHTAVVETGSSYEAITHDQNEFRRLSWPPQGCHIEIIIFATCRSLPASFQLYS